MAPFTPSTASSPSKSLRGSSSPKSSVLRPLVMGETRLLLLKGKVTQVDLKYARKEEQSSAAAQMAYNSVKEEVTDLIASILHLEASCKPPPPQLVLVGPSYTLTCYRLDYKQMREKWEWKLGGEEVGGAESKFKFVFAERRKEGRKEG